MHREACDLGAQPLANQLVAADTPDTQDARFPLRVMVCTNCLLVQLEDTVDPSRMFETYPYLSSVSATWRSHVADFAAMAADRFALTSDSLVIEVGSNDGTLLRPFLARGISCLGIEPAANIAVTARQHGVPTQTAFFSAATAAELVREGKCADLLVANNVLAHVPALTDFVRGLALILAPLGVLSIEVPHVLAMLRGDQFDTIYHEHVCYFSALVLQRVLAAGGIDVFDVAILPTHGGSLRLLAQHTTSGKYRSTGALDRVLAAERAEHLDRPERYATLAQAAARVSGDLRAFLARTRTEGARVAAYGAAAKGTMLLNAAQVTRDDVAFVVDANPLKQGHLLPGSRIPIAPLDRLRAERPDFLLILPWNIAEEVMAATRFIATWGGRFVLPSPTLRVIAA